MSENDYVATAAAEKRFREVLAARFPNHTLDLIEELAARLLADTKIEYKARAKQVTITLDLPDKAATPSESTVLREDGSDPTVTAPDGAPIVAAPATPHITAFVPQQFTEPDFEDVHYD